MSKKCCKDCVSQGDMLLVFIVLGIIALEIFGTRYVYDSGKKTGCELMREAAHKNLLEENVGLYGSEHIYYRVPYCEDVLK